jgi:GntR family transcriptional regulator
VATKVALNPRAAEPLWSQLVTELRRRLAEGAYAERFPTEMELTAEFEVSRATVREAVRRMKDEGLLDARRGSGTFVVRRRLDEVVLGSLASAIAAAGLAEESEVLRLEEAPAGDPTHSAAATALAVDASTPVVWLERLRSAAGRPLALDVSAISVDAPIRGQLVAADLQRGSIYDLLAERFGVQVTGAVEQVRAVQVGPAEAARLELDADEGVLEVERVTYAGNTPVEWRRSLLRGSAYVLAASWGVTPTPA